MISKVPAAGRGIGRVQEAAAGRNTVLPQPAWRSIIQAGKGTALPQEVVPGGKKWKSALFYTRAKRAM